MKNPIKLIYQHKWLILILIITVYLRFKGIYPGYPSHPDEAPISSAWDMILKGNLDPRRYDYPTLIALIHLFLVKFLFIPLAWVKFYIENLGQIIDGFLRVPLSTVDYDRSYRFSIVGLQDLNVIYWGRYITAATGCAVVFLTYLLSKRLFTSLVALSAAFFVAVNFRQVLNSHIGLPDIYNSFFLLLSLIITFKLLESPSRKNYILAFIASTLAFNVKFQVFSFIPLMLAHLSLTIKKSKGSRMIFIKSLLAPSFIFSLGIVPVLTALINPYHLMKFNLFLQTQSYIASKYGVGSDKLNIYPISYLYHFGIGQWLSMLIILGIVISLLKYKYKSIWLLSVVIPFMFVFIYYTRGGFYTRNFVTITPILLIFAGISIQVLFDLCKRLTNHKPLSYLICLILVIVASWGNIEKSVTVTQEFTKPWDINLLSIWLSKNIPEGSTISAHSNVPLPIKNVTRLTYDFDYSFSMDEFTQEGKPDYAIANFAWATGGFYWWMGGGDPKEDFLHLWNKPNEILEYSYPAIALRELEPSLVYSVYKPWYSPDVEFYVAKIPKYQVTEKTKVLSYSFEKDIEGWTKEGKFWTTEDNLRWQDSNLIVEEKPIRLPSLRWQSPIIKVNSWPGYLIEFRTITETKLPKIKAGYLFASFYKTESDAKNSTNRIRIRVSSRTSVINEWLDKNLTGTIPQDAKYMTLGFYSYDLANSSSKLDSVVIYKAKVFADYGGVTLHPYHIDEGNLFPYSHGNL